MNSLKTPPSVGIIANISTSEHREFFVQQMGEPENGLFKPLNFEFDGIAGQIISLDVTSEEIERSKSGYALVQNHISQAVRQLARNPEIKVIAFTASTKRPGITSSIKDEFPNIIFTIGDNGTMLSTLKLVRHFLGPFVDKRDKICVMGGGFIGEFVLSYLTDYGCKDLTIFTKQNKNGIPAFVRKVDTVQKIGPRVKLFISCAHTNKIIPQEFIEILDDQAIIIDVAVPPGVGKDVFLALPGSIKRYDAGDYFLPELKYDFHPKLAHFPKVGFWYGCFTEAVLLGLAVKDGKDLSGHNFFEVNQENMSLIDQLLKSEHHFQVPFINFYEPENYEGLGIQY